MTLTITYLGTAAGVSMKKVTASMSVPVTEQREGAAPHGEDPAADLAKLVNAAVDSGALIAPEGLAVECRPAANDGVLLIATPRATAGAGVCVRCPVALVSAASTEDPSDPLVVGLALVFIAYMLNRALMPSARGGVLRPPGASTPVHMVREEGQALGAASAAQRAAFRRLAARCAINGVILLSDGNLQVGFERSTDGRDREALIAPDGTRLSTADTWGA